MHMTTLLPGLADPVLDSQTVFRRALEALSRPARPVPLTPPTEAPAPLFSTAGALVLALADLDTPVWLDPALDQPAVRDWLRFHTGCPLCAAPEDAAFGLIGAPGALVDLEAFAPGSPEYPDRSATLIVQVDGLTSDSGPVFTGPGIRDRERLAPARLAPEFWDAWAANRALFPQGLDVLFATPAEICGLPRTTKAET